MTAQASRTSQNHHEHLEARLDHDVRILPRPDNDTSDRDSVLLVFDGSAHKPLRDDWFAASLERTLGVRADRALVSLAYADGNKLLLPDDPDFFKIAEAMESRARPGKLGGYGGIRLEREGMSEASDQVAAGIAALISEVYQGDERLRLLYNHTLPQAAEPIEITGPDYNLAGEATREHPAAELREIVGHDVSIRHVQAAPNLARVAFA